MKRIPYIVVDGKFYTACPFDLDTRICHADCRECEYFCGYDDCYKKDAMYVVYCTGYLHSDPLVLRGEDMTNEPTK